MDARIIPFPGRHCDEPQAPLAVGSGPVPRREPEPVGEACAEVSLRLTPLVTGDLDRSLAVRAALFALLEAGVQVRLAGTAQHPVIEGTIRGEDAAVRAATAVLQTDHAVRRASADRFAVSGAIAEGRLVQVLPGVVRRVGVLPPETLADRAAPGQILVGGTAWDRDPRIEVAPAPTGGAPSVFVLRGLR